MIQASVLKSLNSNLVAIIISTEPLFALIFSLLFRYEEFNSMRILGGLIILAAIILPEIYSATFKLKKTFHK
jgi:drug/metabolite transporter (DMT)-like permease